MIITAQTIIVVLDTEGKIITFNPYMEVISGYSIDQVRGNDWFTTFIPGDNHEEIRNMFKKIVNDVHILGNVNPIITKDGKIRYIEWYSKTLRDNDNNVIGVLATGQDITKTREAEEQLKSSLEEKNVLLKEIHHRVKNNMQIISSLLYLQKEYIVDEKDIELFTDSQNRVQTMATIHEQLYQSQDLSKIEFYSFINELTSYFYELYEINFNDVKVIIPYNNIYLDITIAIPCGMIINELISNSFKYAFPKNRKGEIKINLKKSKTNIYTLNYRDNGVGLADGFDFEKSKTLGVKLIDAFVKQLNGSIIYKNKKGISVEINFNE